MIACTPQVLERAGISFIVQTIETTSQHILIRIRSEEMVESGHRDVKVPAVSKENFILSDSKGTELKLVQSSSQGEGPFLGIVDLAFLLDSEIDLGSPLTLASANSRVTVKL